jgi:hypothetical protein
MAMPILRNLTHNQNTHNAVNPVVRRSYDVPVTWTPPTQKGIRQGGTDTIITLYATTPETGSGDPRAGRVRQVNRLNTTTHVG